MSESRSVSVRSLPPLTQVHGRDASKEATKHPENSTSSTEYEEWSSASSPAHGSVYFPTPGHGPYRTENRFELDHATVQAPQNDRPTSSFRRQMSAPSKVSVVDVIRNQVPNALVVSINQGDKLNPMMRSVSSGAERPPTGNLVSVEGSADFGKAFREGVPSFILADGRDESASLTNQLLTTRTASVASAVIVVFLEKEAAIMDKPAKSKVQSFIENGADDVMLMPSSISQLPVMISVSLTKAEMSRKKTVNLTKQVRDYRRQCHGLFWGIGHEIVPELPHVKPQLIEVKGKRVGDIALQQKLGEGEFGAVHVWNRGEENGAVKVISKRGIRSLDEVLQLTTEYGVLKKLNHPNVVKVRNLVHGMQNMYLFMEMGGSSNLFKYIRSEGARCLPWFQASDIFLQIADGLAHCHTNQVAHCDLKPENIVITGDGCAKLVDFGLAVDLTTEIPVLSAPRGTMPFMAPEIMCRSETWDPAAADVWSLGIIYMEMLCGSQAYVKLVGWQGKDLMNVRELPTRADDLKACFARDETEAHTRTLERIAGLCSDTPPKFVIELLGDMLVIGPQDRILAKDAVQRLEECAKEFDEFDPDFDKQAGA